MIWVPLACVAGGIREQASERQSKARKEFNSTLHQSSHGFATRVHGIATKTKALAREIPPATQARYPRVLGTPSRDTQNTESVKYRRLGQVNSSKILLKNHIFSYEALS